MSQTKIRIEHYDGEGLGRVVEFGSWFVGIKNWKPANDFAGFDQMERHLQTDEVFVLLEGACTLLVDHSSDECRTDIRCIPMESGKVYCIPQGVWHNTITSKDSKLVLVENRDTAMANSEIRPLSSTEQNELRTRLRLSR